MPKKKKKKKKKNDVRITEYSFILSCGCQALQLASHISELFQKKKIKFKFSLPYLNSQ